jgi:hypothetical protein
MDRAVDKVKTILILAANPIDTAPLRLDREVREIGEGLQRAQKRQHFQIRQRWATRPQDLQRAILDEAPRIVHFCGHGSGGSGIILENEWGRGRPVTPAALTHLFQLLRDQVDCVLLNACYSQIQGEAIAQHVATVIGMGQEISDRAALRFAIGFYDALGAGKDFAFAYQWGCNAIELQGLKEAAIPVLLQGKTKPEQPTQIFISYQRDSLPDQTVALALHEALGEDHRVAIDPDKLVGTESMAWINQQIRQADFIIALLSAEAVASEMVQLELELAHQLLQGEGKPKILPVRLAYGRPLPYPLQGYLQGIDCAFWQDARDTERLVAQLRGAMVGNPLSPAQVPWPEVPWPEVPTASTDLAEPTPMAQPRSNLITSALPHPEPPEGTMGVESRFYVQRRQDAIALDTIAESGITLTIKGARQMGKSSLLMRVIDRAQQLGKRVAFLDFQLFDQATLAQADDFFFQFCLWLTDTLALEDRVTQYWQRPQEGNRQRCTRFMRREVLPQLHQPLVLAMDEVESIFAAPFRTDFFGMLRSWHNQRATSKPWRQLDLALVTSTEPYQLIADLNQSPFNVGEVLDLEDFDLAQMQDLNQRHQAPLNPNQVLRLMAWVKGHPYLTRRALYRLARGQLTVAELFDQAPEERGPFGDHLRHHLFRLYDRPDLAQAFLEVIRHQRCEDERLFFRLRGAGLVRRQGARVVPRCQLYEVYFQEHLHG